MAITVKYLEELGIEKNVAEKIFAERSKEIEVDKEKREQLEQKLAEDKATIDGLNAEFEQLKENKATAEEWQTKFESLKTDMEEKEKQAEAEKIKAEQTAQLESRFNSCVGDKKFSHEAIKSAYFQKFDEALQSDEYKGLGDADIFHALTKDDARAFATVEAIRLMGGSPGTFTESKPETTRFI